jgi:hypothetical protein
MATWCKVFNDHGAFECMVKVAAMCAPGEVIVYHAWEPYQFKQWKGSRSRLNRRGRRCIWPGGYSQIHYRMCRMVLEVAKV